MESASDQGNCGGISRAQDPAIQGTQAPGQGESAITIGPFPALRLASEAASYRVCAGRKSLAPANLRSSARCHITSLLVVEADISPIVEVAANASSASNLNAAPYSQSSQQRRQQLCRYYGTKQGMIWNDYLTPSLCIFQLPSVVLL